MRARIWCPLIASAISIAVLFACTSSDESATVMNAIAPDASAIEDAGAPTTCRACQNSQCTHEASTCAADPLCAPYLACARACPSDAYGNIIASCDSACASAIADGSSQDEVTALQECRATASCEACIPPFDAGYVDALSCAPNDDGPCDLCFASRCCIEHLPCADGGCDEAEDCLADCANEAGAADQTACLASCYAAAPVETGNYVADHVCGVYRCSLECYATEPTACTNCYNTQCGAELATLFASPDASLLFYCVSLCTVATCETDCETTYPAGVPAFDAVRACSVQCEAACAD